MPKPPTIYLDQASNPRLAPEVQEAVIHAVRELQANPSAIHGEGRRVQQAVDQARLAVARLIQVQPEEIIFTSCGTEANNMALWGLVRAYEKKGKHIVVSSIEHFSVLHVAKRLEKLGWRVTYLPVSNEGITDPETVKRAIADDTVLVAVMHANNEVGAIQPIAEIASITRPRSVLLHCDAVASCGWIPVDVRTLGVDTLAIAANQFGGPGGVGALWVRQGVRLMPLMDGGTQEQGRRPGTENVPGIVGMGKAAEMAKATLPERAQRVAPLRDQLIDGLLNRVDGSWLNGPRAPRLPHNVSFAFEGIDSESAILMLDLAGVACSSGSACAEKVMKASHVLTAMGVPPLLAQGSLLFTLGASTTSGEIDQALEITPSTIAKLRQLAPLQSHS